MLNFESPQPGELPTILTPTGFISEDGVYRIIEGENGDLDFIGAQHFLEQAYLVLENRITESNISNHLGFSIDIFGEGEVASVIDCDAALIHEEFQLSDEKWKQTNAKRLIILNHWYAVSTMVSLPPTLYGEVANTIKGSVPRALYATTRVGYPELDGKSVIRFIAGSFPNVDTIESLHSVLWANMHRPKQ